MSVDVFRIYKTSAAKCANCPAKRDRRWESPFPDRLPFQGETRFDVCTQGVALGWIILAFQAENIRDA
jgi:hypothetical protein